MASRCGGVFTGSPRIGQSCFFGVSHLRKQIQPGSEFRSLPRQLDVTLENRRSFHGWPDRFRALTNAKSTPDGHSVSTINQRIGHTKDDRSDRHQPTPSDRREHRAATRLRTRPPRPAARTTR